METTGHNTPLSEDECRQLLHSRTVGRIAWASRVGQVILPVSYVMEEDRIVFRTAVGSLLSDLVTPQPVTFEIDDLDDETLTGWSVLVQGESGSGSTPEAGPGPMPWAPGVRPVFVRVIPSSYSGRVIAAS